MPEKVYSSLNFVLMMLLPENQQYKLQGITHYMYDGSRKHTHEGFLW